MEIILKQIIDKISAYNILNNLYPGILFCYVLKVIDHKNMLSNNWVENLILFYFIGMVISRIGSLIIEPVMKKIKIKKVSLLQFSSYSDYERACKEDSLIATLSETNNTYRTLISCFVSIFMFKICSVINEICLKHKFIFLQENKEWIMLIVLILIFSFSYVKQTTYVRERVEVVIQRIDSTKES